MGYELSVDIGTTFTAAAVAEDGKVEMVQLASYAASMPTAVFLLPDGSRLVGEPAERRAIGEPGRLAREFKRRLGDTAPIVLGGAPFSVESLLAATLEDVVRRVTAEHGGPPDSVTITHPASFGQYKLDLLSQAVRQAGVSDATLLPEPVAVAIYYASLGRLEEGATVAVYDFGGGTFDATILRKTADGFEMQGLPEGIDRLGGIDFDDAVLAHVLQSIEGRAPHLEPSDGQMRSALARLRTDSRSAKEALSSDTEAVIPVLLPGFHSEVRITRAEFEAMIRPRLAETVAALSRAMRSANASLEEIDRILLTGGTSRIPLVGEFLSSALGRPLAVDAHPKHAVALGAVQSAAAASDARLFQGISAPQVPPVVQVPYIPQAEASEPAQAAAIVAAPPLVEVPPAVPAVPVLASTPVTVSAPAASAAPSPASPEPTAAPAAAPPAALSAALPGRENGGEKLGRGPLPRKLLLGAAAGLIAVVGGIAAFFLIGGSGGGTTALAADIQGITVANNRYEVTFVVHGFTISPQGNFVAFYWDNQGISKATPWTSTNTFTSYTPQTRPSGATKICIVVADSTGKVFAGPVCAAPPS